MDSKEIEKLNNVIFLSKKKIRLLENGDKKDNVRHILETCSQIKSSSSLKIKKLLISKLENEYKNL